MCNMLYMQIKQNVPIYEPYLPGEVATSSFISDFIHVYTHKLTYTCVCVFACGDTEVCVVYT